MIQDPASDQQTDWLWESMWPPRSPSGSSTILSAEPAAGIADSWGSQCCNTLRGRSTQSCPNTDCRSWSRSSRSGSSCYPPRTGCSIRWKWRIGFQRHSLSTFGNSCRTGRSALHSSSPKSSAGWWYLVLAPALDLKVQESKVLILLITLKLWLILMSLV